MTLASSSIWPMPWPSCILAVLSNTERLRQSSSIRPIPIPRVCWPRCLAWSPGALLHSPYWGMCPPRYRPLQDAIFTLGVPSWLAPVMPYCRQPALRSIRYLSTSDRNTGHPAVPPLSPPPATASAEGAQLNGRPFPATASAEGRLIKGGPFLRERAWGRAGGGGEGGDF